MFYPSLVAALLAAVQNVDASPAQPVAMPAAAEAAQPPETCCIVPARTPVEIEMAEAVSSRTAHSGQRFAIRLAAPLAVDGRVLLPAGTPGEGEVVHAARAGAAGRGGELTLAVRHLDGPNGPVALRSLKFGGQGDDSSSATAIASSVVGAAVPVAAVLGFLIRGGNMEVPAGTRGFAMTRAEAVLPPAAIAIDQPEGE